MIGATVTEYQRDILQSLAKGERHSLDLSRELRRYIDVKTLRTLESRGMVAQVPATVRAEAIFGLRWTITAAGRSALSAANTWDML